MFAHLIEGLRQAGLPTSITEYLTLLGAMKAGVAEWSVDDFYYLSRATLVKDERHLDRFDRVFAQCFKGLEAQEGVLPRNLPEEWLRKLAEKFLTPEEMAKIEALGGFEALNVFFQIRDVPGLKKKPSTAELLDWLKLLMVEDLPVEALRTNEKHLVIPPLYGALLKNEQDVHLFERLAFLARRGA